MESVSSPSTMRLFTTTMSGIKRSCPDNSDNTSDSDSECGGAILRQDLMGDLGAQNGTGLIDGPKPGKKTKGRVKIKMEFIENKLRRYTTFSKRKTGIMKKAYELSTLTGTQVMLLVASETGHVYTFATRKLQPMITSESGKALIQTCLNSPDSPLDVAKATSDDQRMNPTGYEETDLSYAVSDDEVVQQPPQQQLQQQPPMSSSPSKAEVTKSAALSSLSSSSPSRRCHHHHQSAVSSTSTDCTSASSSPPYQHQFGQDMVASNLAHRSKPSSSCATEMLRLKQEPSSVCQTSLSSRDNNNHSHSKQKAAAAAAAAAAPSVSRSMQTSTSAAATALSLSSSPISHPPATGASQDSLHPGQLLINQCKPQPHQQQQQQLQQQMFYRIPGTNQIISLSLTGAGGQGSLLYQTYTTSSPSPSTLSSPTAATTGTSPSSSSSSSSSPFSQSTSNPLSGTDGFLLNLPQAASAAAAALGTKTLDAGNGATQQFITIPVPISLSSSSQMLPFFNHQASIKTELLPTDLRFNGLEKTAK